MSGTFLTRHLSFIPKRLAPSNSDIQAAVLWGGTAAFAGLWLVQPFDWINNNFIKPKEEESKEEEPKEEQKEEQKGEQQEEQKGEQKEEQ